MEEKEEKRRRRRVVREEEKGMWEEEEGERKGGRGEQRCGRGDLWGGAAPMDTAEILPPRCILCETSWCSSPAHLTRTPPPDFGDF